MKYLKAPYRGWSSQDGLNLQNTDSIHYPTIILVLLIYFLQYETPFAKT